MKRIIILPSAYIEYFKLASLWIGWCFIHSFLITSSVTKYFQARLKNKYHYFRLFYNLIAIISFLLIWRYNPIIENSILFSWDGYLKTIQIPLLIMAIALFICGAKRYDMLQFLGIRQLIMKQSNTGISKVGGLNIMGVHKYTRHPWYLGGILILWTDFNSLVISNFIMNVILTLYLIVGAYLEENKLVTEFGEAYQEYQNNVSILFPFKSFKR